MCQHLSVVGCTTAELSVCTERTLRNRVSSLLVAFTSKHSGICLTYVGKIMFANLILLV